MKNLESILTKYASPNLAGELEEAPPPPDVARLVGELRELRRGNEIYFQILVGMLVAVFLAALVLTFIFAGHPKALVAVCGGSGVTVGFAIRALSLLWKQKVLLETLLVLLPDMGPAAQQQVIDMILTFLQQGKAVLAETPLGSTTSQAPVPSG